MSFGMTDKDALIRICEHLGLTRDDSIDPYGHIGPTTFAVFDFSCGTSKVWIGAGEDGHRGSCAAFWFDPDGKAIDHGAWKLPTPPG